VSGVYDQHGSDWGRGGNARAAAHFITLPIRTVKTQGHRRCGETASPSASAVLKTVIDPELGYNIVDIGLVL
jgi:hypothetical protein